MTSPLGTVVVTGAAGQVGRTVRTGLQGLATRVVLADLVEIPDPGPAEESLLLDVRDQTAVLAALAGADAVVHLGGIPDEAPLLDLLTSNVLGTHHILEAARVHSLRRVVPASSNRLTGYYPTTQEVSPTDLPRPDGPYGVSKAAMEALASSTPTSSPSQSSACAQAASNQPHPDPSTAPPGSAQGTAPASSTPP